MGNSGSHDFSANTDYQLIYTKLIYQLIYITLKAIVAIPSAIAFP